MSLSWHEAVIRVRDELKPIPTEATPKIEPLETVRAVIFDVYGTLIVSGSGDVGAANEDDRGDQIGAALAAAGIESAPGGRLPTVDDLHENVRSMNEARKSETCPKPEIDIVDAWRRTLDQCGVAGNTEQCNRLAAEYEARANPTWPMPGASHLLKTLANRGFRMGIVSNAQVFTLPLVEELGGRFGSDSVFDPDLCVFSNRYRQAKPGPRLFDVLSEGLNRSGLRPEEAIYVGNDRLNDVWAATQAGLRTAWFAGDRRSLRDRRDDPRVKDLPHDIVLTELQQILDALPASPGDGA